ncbi:MAG TPA: PH domain-containing protein, partial [Clostridiales bacterium]|nr:PH domain-containing protein [Clostridiales bacterium]
MSEKKRFHPIALVTYLVNALKSLAYLIIIAFINVSSDPFFAVVTVFAIILISLIWALIRYFTRTYSINNYKIIMYSGIFVKKETEIPYERIQTIKQRQWFFYKPFNIVQILIETGSTSDKEAEASLLAVDASLIDLIEDYRHKRKKNEKSDVESTNDLSDNYIEESNPDDQEALEDEEIIYNYKLSYKEILLYAITDLNIFVTTVPILLIIISFFLENTFLLDK